MIDYIKSEDWTTSFNKNCLYGFFKNQHGFDALEMFDDNVKLFYNGKRWKVLKYDKDGNQITSDPIDLEDTHEYKDYLKTITQAQLKQNSEIFKEMNKVASNKTKLKDNKKYIIKI